MLALSTKIENCQSSNSTIDMPYIAKEVILNPSQDRCYMLSRNTVVSIVKLEKMDTIVELSSKLEGESPKLTLNPNTISSS